MNHVRSYLNKTEIAKQLGYFPAFLLPAINSSLILRSLIQQTLSAYVNNPLPNIFKEKLFVYLSRYFGISYLTICHSCTLKSLGISASEILALETIGSPQTEAEIEADLDLLQNQNCDRYNWQTNEQLETSLLRCSLVIFLDPTQATNCIKTLKKLLGNVYYNYLVILLGYIKLCHQWVDGNPQISYQQDRRSQLHLGALLMSESRLVKFFQANLQLENSTAPQLVSPGQSDLALPSATQVTFQSNWQLQKTTLTDCLANAPFPVMIHSQDERILYLNRNWIEITGYNTLDISTIREWQSKAQVQPREIIQSKPEHPNCQTSWGVSTMETPTQKLQEIAESLSQMAEEISQIELTDAMNLGRNNEVTITTKTGEQRIWESCAVTISLGDRCDQLTVLIAKDLTEALEQKSQLTKLETQLAMVQTTTKLGNLYWNLTNNQLEISPCGLSILGLNNFDGSYHSFLQVIHPEERVHRL